jgi:hypothetical protein
VGNRDRYHLSHGVHEPCMPLHRGKAIIRSVLAWGDRRASSGSEAARRGPPVRPVRVTGHTGARQSAW